MSISDVEIYMDIGSRLKELRTAVALTQEQVARKIGTGRVNYTRYENNSSRPDYETLVALADLFDVTTDELLGRGD